MQVKNAYFRCEKGNGTNRYDRLSGIMYVEKKSPPMCIGGEAEMAG
jgi:hypothetical protein